HSLPNTGFHLMGRATLSGRPFYVCFEISQSEFQCITVALALGLRHAFHHAAPLVRGVFSVFYPNVTSGSRLFHTFLSISLYVKGPRSDGRCERSTGHARLPRSTRRRLSTLPRSGLSCA